MSTFPAHRIGQVLQYEIVKREKALRWPDPNRRSGWSDLEQVSIQRQAVLVVQAFKSFAGEVTGVRWQGCDWLVMETKFLSGRHIRFDLLKVAP